MSQLPFKAVFSSITTLLLLGFTFIFTQPGYSDSTGVAVRVDLLIKKAKSSYDASGDSIIKYGNMALKLSEQHNYIEGIAEAYNVIGYGYRNAGDSYTAIQTYKKGIEFTKKHQLSRIQSAILLNKGNAEEGIGNYIAALEDLLQSISIKQKINDSLGIAKCLNNIAQVYSRQGDLEKSLEYFFNSLEIKEKFHDTISIGKTYNNIGVIYTDLKKYDESLRYLNLALKMYEAGGASSATGTALGNIARTYDLMGLKDTALIFYKTSLNYIIENEDLFDEAVTRINIGSLYIDIKDYANAKIYLDQGLELAKKINSKEDLKEAYHYLAVLYSLKGNYKEAFEMQQQYQAVNDTLLNEETSAVLTEMHIKYETEKKDEENRYLTKENELQKTILERNTYFTWGLALLSILILIIAFLFIQQTRLRSKQVAIELEQKILRSQMNPHFIFNSLQSIQGYIFEKNALEAGKYLSDFSKLIRLILENSFDEKIPISREIETLTYYLNLQKLRFSDKLNYELLVDPALETEQYEVPPMILQPFIENAIEHGIKPKEGAGKVVIHINLKDDIIIFTLEDDGVGRFAQKHTHKNDRHKPRALSITTERMKLFNKKSGRKMNIRYTDLHNPTGTVVTIEIPV